MEKKFQTVNLRKLENYPPKSDKIDFTKYILEIMRDL